jgi:hypothetical protein
MYVFVYYPFNDNGWTGLIKNLLPNIIIDAISIVVTAFVVTHFLSKAPGRREKEESFQTIRVQHSMLVNKIVAQYITMIRKQPHTEYINTYKSISSSYEFQMHKLHHIANNMGDYLKKDFFNEKVIYNLKIFPNITISEPDEIGHYASKHRYLLDYFLESTKEELEKFIIKYADFIPKELSNRIVHLESMILADKEFVAWLPNGVWTLKDHRDAYKELGNRIHALLSYYEEFHKNN